MRNTYCVLALAFFQCLTRQYCTAFLSPVAQPSVSLSSPINNHSPLFDCNRQHVSLKRQRQSVAQVQTMGLFGLGGPEIVVILVAAAFLVGPQQIGNFVGKLKSDFDDVPEELKRIPEEFQKGIEEGEINARSRNAKKMDKVPDPPSLPEQSDTD